LKRKASILLFAFLLLAGGGYFAYEGLKIELKARAAQILLQYSWHKTLTTGKNYQPWPSFDGTSILLLEIPNHNISQIVLKGNLSGQSLAFGPSFDENSFLPHEQKVTIISSHRDSHGVYIKKLQLGEEIRLQDQHKNWYSYTIDDFFIINVNEEQIAMENNSQHLLLVTCFPFDSLQSGTPYRYVVSAKKYLI
jgi:sortase A